MEYKINLYKLYFSWHILGLIAAQSHALVTTQQQLTTESTDLVRTDFVSTTTMTPTTTAPTMTPTTTATTMTPTTTTTTTSTTISTASITSTANTTPDDGSTGASDKNPPDEESGVGVPVIIGAVIGIVAGIAVVIIIILLLLWRQSICCFREKETELGMDISMPTNPLPPWAGSKPFDVENARVGAPQSLDGNEPRYSPSPTRHDATQNAGLAASPSYSNIGSVQTLTGSTHELPQTIVPAITITDSEYLEVPETSTGMRRDPTYTNLPKYDVPSFQTDYEVPPHAFKRKQTFPGDLAIPEGAFQRKESNVYLLPSNVLGRVFQRKQSDMYVTPMTVSAYRRKESDIYMNPVQVTGPKMFNIHSEIDPDVDGNDDMPPPQPCGRRVSSGYIEVPDATDQQPHDGQLPTNMLDHLTRIHQHAQQESPLDSPRSDSCQGSPRQGSALDSPRSDSCQGSPRQGSALHTPIIDDGIYLNMQQIRSMARKDSYPGDIALPPHYGHIRKKSFVPFAEEDIYQNERPISVVHEEDEHLLIPES